MSELLNIEHLSVSFAAEEGKMEAVRDVSFSLKSGEVLAIVGESGCGKSVLCKSIMKLLPKNGWIENGSIAVNGEDIAAYPEKKMQKLRGSMFSMVFQDPMSALDPTVRIGRQIAEAIRMHNRTLSREEIGRRVTELLELVGIDHVQERCEWFPHQFSGGMRQRSVLAVALAADPKILIADEPTTALDVTIQAQILQLLKEIQKQLHMAMIFVSHNLGVVADIADRVAIMYAGKIVEIGTKDEIFSDPRHPYTRGLLQAHPSMARGKCSLKTIPGMPPVLINPPRGDAFAARNPYALPIDFEEQPPMFPVSDTHFAATWLLDPRFRGQETIIRNQENGETKWQVSPDFCVSEEPLVEVRHLTHVFAHGSNHPAKAVDDVSFTMKKGEIFGLVGESGSGKSTVARCLMNIYQPSGGEILFDGINICDKKEFRSHRKMLQTQRQIIFQDSASSLNPRMKVADIIAEPLRISHRKTERESTRKEAEFQLRCVGMESMYLDKYPAQLSGGQRQRVAIARALSMEPKLLVADEPVAALDVSIQAQIVNLFRHLREEHGFTILFIAHDLAMVEFLCDRVGVMNHGQLVEVGTTEDIFYHPTHPYTKKLLKAVPMLPGSRKRYGGSEEQRENG